MISRVSPVYRNRSSKDSRPDWTTRVDRRRSDSPCVTLLVSLSVPPPPQHRKAWVRSRAAEAVCPAPSFLPVCVCVCVCGGGGGYLGWQQRVQSQGLVQRPGASQISCPAARGLFKWDETDPEPLRVQMKEVSQTDGRSFTSC